LDHKFIFVEIGKNKENGGGDHGNLTIKYWDMRILGMK
jgi:hypothetical protein